MKLPLILIFRKKTIYAAFALFLSLLAFGILFPAYSAARPAQARFLSADTGEPAVKLPIIMYHHIDPSLKDCGDYVVTPETLEADLAYLKAKGCTSITTRQLIDFSRGEAALPERPILITFDDGFESFGTYGLPLFEKYEMYAVMAVVGKYADDYTNTEDHNLKYSHFSWPALVQLEASPYVELAAHSYDMHSLGSRKGCKIMPGESAQAYRAALNQDLEQLESRFLTYVGETPRVFAYPYGFTCEESKNVLLEHGYEVFFTCNERVNLLSGSREELLDLGRFNRPNGLSTEAFFQKVLGE